MTMVDDARRSDMETMHEIRRSVETEGDLDGLRALLGGVVGRPCWSARLGYGDELILDLGERMAPTVKWPGAPPKGEWVVQARATPWRLCSPTGAPLEGDPRDALGAMEGATVTRVEIGCRSLSLSLDFSSGVTLEIAPEAVDDGPVAAWEVLTPRRAVIAAGPGAVWSYAPPSQP